MKNNALFTVPVVNGVAVYPKAELKALLKGTGWGLRLFGRNPDRKQFANDPMHHVTLRQNPPVRIGTSAVVYLRCYNTNHDWSPSCRSSYQAAEAKMAALIKYHFPELFDKAWFYREPRTVFQRV